MCHFVVYMILNSRALLGLSIKFITLCLFYFSQTSPLHYDVSLRCTYGAIDLRRSPFGNVLLPVFFFGKEIVAIFDDHVTFVVPILTFLVAGCQVMRCQ